MPNEIPINLHSNPFEETFQKDETNPMKEGKIAGRRIQLDQNNSMQPLKIHSEVHSAKRPVNYKIQTETQGPKVLEKLEDEMKLLDEELAKIHEKQFSLIKVDSTRMQYSALALSGGEGADLFVEGIEFAKEFIEGKNFLQEVVPYAFLEELKIFENAENMSRIVSLSNALLVALNTGLNGASLVYKSYLLDESEKLLKQAQESLKQYQESGGMPLEALALLGKKLLKWEHQLNAQRMNMETEKKIYGISLASTATRILSEPLKYLPVEKFTLASPFLKISSVLLKAFEALVTGIELLHTSHEKKTMDDWAGKHHRWEKMNQTYLEQRKLDKDQNLNRLIEKFTFPELLSIFKKVKFGDGNFEEALKFFGTKNKEDLNQLFHDYPKIKANISQVVTTLFPSYEIKEEKASGVFYFTLQSEDLLSKREKIRNEKIQQLKQEFSSKELEIREMMYNSFKLAVQQWARYDDSGKWIVNPEALNPWVIKGSQHPIVQKLNSLKSEEELSELRTLVSEKADELFTEWFGAQTEESKLGFYVDHKETYEKATMGALNELIGQKHILEKKLIDFKHSSTKVRFGVALALLGASAVLTVVSLLALPVPGLGFMFLTMTGVSFGLSAGIMADTLRRSMILKPASTAAMFKGLYFKLAYANLRKAILSYKQEIRHQKLKAVENKIEEINKNTQLGSVEKEKAVQIQKKLYQEINAELDKKEKQVEKYNQRLAEYKQKAIEKGWNDFSYHASLKKKNQKNEDVLLAFNAAFKECDLSLLSKKNQELLEIFFGVSVKEMQKLLKNEPEAFKNEMLNFFGSTESSLLLFIKSQKKIEELR